MTTSDHTSVSRLVVIATTVAAVGIDLAYGHEASLVVMLVFGPFAASALLPPRDTAWTSISAVAIAFALGWPDGTIDTPAHLTRVAAVAAGSALALRLAQVRSQREAQLAELANVAEVAQQAILRPLPSAIGGVRLAARYVSASSGARIGGDFYDAVETADGFRLVVGDVRGKGLDAVRLAAALLGEFRCLGSLCVPLGEVVGRMDLVAAATGGPEDFATAVVCEIQHDTLRLIRCGHPYPLQTTSVGAVTEIAVSGTLPLGLGADGHDSVTMPLEGVARIVFCSDGALEGRDAHGRDFDLAHHVALSRNEPAEQALDRILAGLRRHVGGHIDDDVVLVAVEPRGARITSEGAPVTDHLSAPSPRQPGRT